MPLDRRSDHFEGAQWVASLLLSECGYHDFHHGYPSSDYPSVASPSYASLFRLASLYWPIWPLIKILARGKVRASILARPIAAHFL